MKYNHPGHPRTFDGTTDSQVLRAAVWDIERVISFMQRGWPDAFGPRCREGSINPERD